MSYLATGVLATSRKENEARLPIHPRHLGRIPEALRPHLAFECGYGERFGMGDDTLEELGFSVAERTEILAGREIVVLPKITAADLSEAGEGGVVWGWPHCVQQREVTQVAIDRRLTLIAWEGMFEWGGSGERGTHVFYKNNELAGYCGVLHALEIVGWDGLYGPRRGAVVLGFGSVSRGAVFALLGRGFTDISIYTQRPPHLVGNQVLGCSYHQMRRADAAGGEMTAVDAGGGTRSLVDVLAETDIIVNGTLQDTERPLDYLRSGDEERLRRGALIVDVSCDEGMGFAFARPTTFETPTLGVDGGRVTYYAVDHTPSYLWEAATWEISAALLPYLEAVMAGPGGWRADSTIERAVEIREGRVLNERILSFQQRAADYPHAPLRV